MIRNIEHVKRGYFYNTMSSTSGYEVAFYFVRRTDLSCSADCSGFVAKSDLRSGDLKLYDCESCQIVFPKGIVFVGSEFLFMGTFKGTLVGDGASSSLEVKWWDKDTSEQWSVQWVASVSESA